MSETAPVAVLDAGVGFGFLLENHASHRKIVGLFGQGRAGKGRLVMSVVNLAEILLHLGGLARAKGFDIVMVLQSHGLEFHPAGIAVARRVGEIQESPISLADRFCVATAELVKGRLYTTDRELAETARARRLAVTHFPSR